MVFDKIVYKSSWEETVSNEIFRQRDKSNNNSIGYFHQRIFQYFPDCHVPDNGTEGGWDVIFKRSGIDLPDGDTVSTVYVEMKNKHNTMNSAAAGKTYIKMQNQLLQDDDCACFLVEAIAKKSQNIKWNTTVDKRQVSHKRIRRVSIDQFYSLVTGEKEAFYKLCLVLPQIIKKVVDESKDIKTPQDTVMDELRSMAMKMTCKEDELSIAMAVYMLGFSTYYGFNQLIPDQRNEMTLQRLYEYAKGLNNINQP